MHMQEQDKAHITTLIGYCNNIHARGDVPATSGNFSVRAVEDGAMYVTRSGKHKGHLRLVDFMPMQLTGACDAADKPSAESALHLQVYNQTNAQAVLHSHSKLAIKLAQRSVNDAVVLENYELLKAFNGINTHEAQLVIPIVENNQDMSVLSQSVAPYFKDEQFVAYIIQGHGLYVWAQSLERAWHYLEALEYLFDLELSKSI